MFHNFFEVSRNSRSIAAIFEEVLGHYSQRKIIGLNQRFLKDEYLKVILQDDHLSAYDINAIYPKRKFVPQKVKRMIAFLSEKKRIAAESTTT